MHAVHSGHLNYFETVVEKKLSFIRDGILQLSSCVSNLTLCFRGVYVGDTNVWSEAVSRREE